MRPSSSIFKIKDSKLILPYGWRHMFWHLFSSLWLSLEKRFGHPGSVLFTILCGSHVAKWQTRAASFLCLWMNNKWIQNLPRLQFVAILLLLFLKVFFFCFLPMIPKQLCPLTLQGQDADLPQSQDAWCDEIQSPAHKLGPNGWGVCLCGAHGRGGDKHHASLGWCVVWGMAEEVHGGLPGRHSRGAVGHPGSFSSQCAGYCHPQFLDDPACCKLPSPKEGFGWDAAAWARLLRLGHASAPVWLAGVESGPVQACHLGKQRLSCEAAAQAESPWEQHGCG